MDKLLSCALYLVPLVISVLFPDSYLCQCNPNLCQLPDCYCPGTQRPSQIGWEDTPQMIMLTFDDAVLQDHGKYYDRLFNKDRVNPSGCPIQATFFVCHNWTDYEMVGQLYRDGHEMASHTKTHRMPQSWWTYASYGDWEKELEGQRDNLEQLAGVARKDMLGARVPYLETGGDAQFQLMTDTGYLYDSSFMTGPFTEGGVWPFTLHYPPTTTYCSNNNCPKKSYPSIWEIPLNRWVGPDGRACPMMDSCDRQPRDKQDAVGFLRKNFDRHYRGNRAPLGMHLHATWFDNAEFKLDALEEFLDEILQKGDVYLVTMQQVLRWMVQPQTTTEATYFKHWRTSCKNGQALPKPYKVPVQKPAKIGRYKKLDTPHKAREGRKELQELTTPMKVNIPTTTKQSKVSEKPYMAPKQNTPRPRLPYFTRPKVNYTPIPSGLEAFPQPGRNLYNNMGRPYQARREPYSVTQGYPGMNKVEHGSQQWNNNAHQMETNHNKPTFELDMQAKVLGSDSLKNQELNIETEEFDSGRERKGFRVKIHGEKVEVIATDGGGERKEGSENVAGKRQSQAGGADTSGARAVLGVTNTTMIILLGLTKLCLL